MDLDKMNNKEKMRRSQAEQYEMVESRDWSNRWSAVTDNRHNFTHRQYSHQSLDEDWYPVVNQFLKKTPSDTVDYAYRISLNNGDENGRPSFGELSDEIDGRGTFDAKEFELHLRSMRPGDLEDRLGISYNKIKDIIRRSDKDKDGIIHYKDWIETVKRYRLSTEQEHKLMAIGRSIAYVEEFTCSPPTLFMILVTLLETVIFTYQCLHLESEHGLNITMDGPVPYCSVLIYNPTRRWEIWRYVTYMFVHIGITHFVFNMIMQICVGVFLEMEQEGFVGSLRIMAVYLSGVIAGSLGTSLSDPDTYMAGASGGVYALISAHLATLALNWQEDSSVRIQKVIHKPITRILRLTFISFLTIHDVGYAIYVRVFTEDKSRVGFMGHLCGALAGLLVGIFVLQNRRVRSWEPVVQWISFTLFLLGILFAIIWNIWGNEWVPKFYAKPDYRLYDDESGNCKHYDYL